MAYQSIERLLSRRGEKVAAFLTVENAVGISVLAGPFLVVGDAPLLLRAGMAILAAVLGFLVTTETDGMMFCERVLWRVRGEARLLARGRTLAPDDLPGTRTVTSGHRAVAHNGIIRKSRYRRGPAGALVRPRRDAHVATVAFPEVHHADRPA